MQGGEHEFDPWNNWAQSHNDAHGQGQWDAFDQYTNPNAQRPFWRINRKETEGLFKFDGGLSGYRAWKSLIRNHASEEGPAWRQILDHAEGFDRELSLEELKHITVFGVNGLLLTNDLWSFLLRWIGPTLYLRRKRMGPAIEGNGIELWRRPVTECQGSDELVKLAGRTKFLQFGQCRSLKHLIHHLDEWLELSYKFGGDMGPEVVRTLLLKTLPDGMRSEVYKRSDLNNMDVTSLVDWARHQTIWERSEELAIQMVKPERATGVQDVRRRRRRREPGPAEQPAPVEPHPQAPDGSRAALRPARPGQQQRRPGSARTRTPTRSAARSAIVIQFQGCDHCGDPNHSRSDKNGRPGCPSFAALLKQHSGLPQGYKGALDKCIEEKVKATRPSVTSVNHATDGPAMSEHTERDISDHENEDRTAIRAVSSTHAPEVVEHSPAVQAVSDSDDESDVALPHRWVHSVRPASSSRQRKLRTIQQRVNVLSDDDLVRLEALPTFAVNKKSAKPPLEVMGKVWAMLDSGSQPTIANCRKVFPDHVLQEPDGRRRGLKYKVADGRLVPNQGQVQVKHIDKDGATFDFTFQHANVHRPILSVSELVHKGCVDTFHKAGGHIQYPDGRRIHFVSKEGVFFAALNFTWSDKEFPMRGGQ